MTAVPVDGTVNSPSMKLTSREYFVAEFDKLRLEDGLQCLKKAPAALMSTLGSGFWYPGARGTLFPGYKKMGSCEKWESGARTAFYRAEHDPSLPISVFLDKVANTIQIADVILMNLDPSWDTVRTIISSSKIEHGLADVKDTLLGSTVTPEPSNLTFGLAAREISHSGGRYGAGRGNGQSGGGNGYGGSGSGGGNSGGNSPGARSTP
ncbi:hypothetical protein C8R46DRAFT_1035885 [Mycena filopes]|nr:hypothetical protein C8R46DRAFT_1035885 [Mycena filopes]